MLYRTTWESIKVGQEAEVVMEKHGQGVYCGLHRKGKERQANSIRIGQFK